MGRHGADPAAFDGVRVATAELSGTQLGQTVGKTIYVDATAAGYGWADVDLFEVIEHELGHVLGYAHSDADAQAVMRATLSVMPAPSTISVTADLLAPPPALLAPNGPAAIAVMQQALSPRAQPPLAAPAASLSSALAASPTARTSTIVAPLKALLLRGIAPTHASLVGFLASGGRVYLLDTYLAE